MLLLPYIMVNKDYQWQDYCTRRPFSAGDARGTRAKKQHFHFRGENCTVPIDSLHI